MNEKFNIHDPSFKEGLKQKFSQAPEGYFEAQKEQLLKSISSEATKSKSIVPLFLKWTGAIAAIIVLALLLKDVFVTNSADQLADNNALSVDQLESIWIDEAEAFDTPLLAMYDSEEDYEQIFIDDETRASDIESLFEEEWDDEYDY